MGLTTDLGHRIELVSMDPHFHQISIALYRQDSGEGPVFLVHSYSQKQGTRWRLEFIARAMVVLGGLEPLPAEDLKLRFPCRFEHPLACRRVFLEACKLDPQLPLETRPLSIQDKKSNRTLRASSLGNGLYELAADGPEEEKASRIAAVANGLVKLAQLEAQGPDLSRVVFACRQPHDALVGLLLARALNVRAVLREQELAASRGILSAPSAQKP